MVKSLLNFVTANYIKLVVTAIVLVSWLMGDISIKNMLDYVIKFVTALIAAI